MRIGIDFDNTIVCYDEVFYLAALEKNLIPANIHKSKGKVRDYLRSIGKEDAWIELQGYVYGKRLDLAQSFEGVKLFFENAKKNQIEITIISHKTLYPYVGEKYNLHESAKNWLNNQSFYNSSIPTFFELTLQEKLNRIAIEKCDYFIDDLPELLDEKNFPENTKKILFDPNNLHENSDKFLKQTSWKDLLKKF